MRGDEMSVNKVIYHEKTLIDLTSDTVTADTLFKGCTAHRADGTIITGTMFENYPDKQCFYDDLCDLSGDIIKDSLDNAVEGKTVYRKV